MNNISKKIVAMITTCIIALGICLPVFAAEPAVAAEVPLANASFVKDTGGPLSFGMGTGVIDSANSVIDGNLIYVKLQPHDVQLIENVWAYTGEIQSAYYVDGNGAHIDDVNLVDNGYLTLDTSKVQNMPEYKGNIRKGIRLELHFNMQPHKPPMMPNPAIAYFTCDNIQNMQGN